MYNINIYIYIYISIYRYIYIYIYRYIYIYIYRYILIYIYIYIFILYILYYTLLYIHYIIHVLQVSSWNIRSLLSLESNFLKNLFENRFFEGGILKEQFLKIFW